VNRQAAPADLDRVIELAGPAVFFSQLGKRDRRRVLLDPSPEIVEP
jgi:hypothetical protein